MGFNAPSYIQETALPALLADPLVHHCHLRCSVYALNFYTTGIRFTFVGMVASYL